MQNIRINIFGKAIWMCSGEMLKADQLRFEEFCKENDLAPEIEMFSPGFLEKMKLLRDDGRQILNWKDLNSEFQCYGYRLDPKTTVEIKINGRRATKFPITSVLSDGLLFPIFETVEKKVKLKSAFVLRENLIGLTGVYRFTKVKFDVGLLQFVITDVWFGNEVVKLITGIVYDGKILERGKDDCLVTGWGMVIG